MNHSELREQALRANLDIVRTGLVVLTFGNVSAVDRNAGVMAIKPSGVPYDELRPDQWYWSILRPERHWTVSFARRRTRRPTSSCIAGLPRVGGIVHTHSPYATAWAQARRPIPCLGTTHADHFEGPVPVTRGLSREELSGDYETATGDVIAETYAGLGLDPLHMPAILVSSHGPFAWGATAAEAVENAVALEEVAASTLRACQIAGAVPEIDPALLDKHFQRKHGIGAYYGQPT